MKDTKRKEMKEIVNTINRYLSVKSLILLPISLLQVVQDVMVSSSHLLHRGEVYYRHPQATVTYTPLCSVHQYVDSLMQNPDIMPLLISHHVNLKKLLGSPDCEVVPQLILNYDLIEVSVV